jgi:hypothetical protein
MCTGKSQDERLLGGCHGCQIALYISGASPRRWSSRKLRRARKRCDQSRAVAGQREEQVNGARVSRPVHVCLSIWAAHPHWKELSSSLSNFIARIC